MDHLLISDSWCLSFISAKSALLRSCPCWGRMYAECASVRRTELRRAWRVDMCAEQCICAFCSCVGMIVQLWSHCPAHARGSEEYLFCTSPKCNLKEVENRNRS